MAGVVAKKVKTRRQRNLRRTSASEGSNFNVNNNAGAVTVQQQQQHFSTTTIGTTHYFRNRDLSPSPHSSSPARNQDQSGLLRTLMILLVFLIILNMFLVYKMWSLESKLSYKSESLAQYQLLRAEPPQSSKDWIDILQKQETLHNQELESWRTAVESASALLRQSERNMQGMAESFNNQIVRNILKFDDSNTYRKAVFDNVIDKEL